jgi:hypothetical protein
MNKFAATCSRYVRAVSLGKGSIRFISLVIVALAFVACSSVPSSQGLRPVSAEDLALERAFQERKSHIQVEGQGIVKKLLPDDTNGSKHQRFVVQLASGQTILVAHNTDLAPRVSSLREGDTIAFNGEYEWNPEGGVVHWTHNDPAKQHPPGWLKHNGKTYQ